MMHYLSIRRKGKAGFISFKLNMSKAYDRIGWNFLDKMMKLLGFKEWWIEKIKHCVRSVKFVILINGEVKGFITPTQGLRQGDLLSPYLFLICTEGLTALNTKAQMEKTITGIRISHRGPFINHLFFVDVSILICKADMDENKKILILLKKYEQAFGQQINREKTSIIFSKNVLLDTQKKILDFWRLTETKEHSVPGLTAIGSKRLETSLF